MYDDYLAMSSNKPAWQQPEKYDADLFKKDYDCIFVNGEFLYWSVLEAALDYAIRMNHPAPSGTPESIVWASGTVKSAEYNLDPGFRVAVGFYNAPKYWEVRGQYTRITNRGFKSTGKPSPTNEFLNGTFPQVLTTNITGSQSRIHLNYNVFDLLVDRVFDTNPHLRLRLMGGPTAAWMDQDWKVQYFDASNNNTTIRNRWHFIGGGLRAGIQSDWFWGNNMFVTGVATTAALVGRYTNDAKQTATTVTGGPVRDAKFEDTRPTFTAQVMFGPSWQKNFPRNRVEIFVGYEMTAWLNLQEIRRSSGDIASAAKETWISPGMLALYGLTTRATVDF